MNAAIPLSVLVEALACLKLARVSCLTDNGPGYGRMLDAYCNLDQYVAPLLEQKVEVAQ